MQSYSVASLITMMAALAISAYAFSASTVPSAPRTAVLTNAKPLSDTIIERDVVVEAERSAPSSFARSFTAPTLPPEFSALVPEVTLNASTRIGSLQFAADITEEYEPVAVRNEFGEGEFTLYAVFNYADMSDGMTWSWVWRQDGDVIGGGEQMWNYGDAGPGYVYFQPEEGFTAGDYSLEVWVNGEFMEESSVEVASGVANQ
ncbi:MAG: hypothetical protein ACPG8W_21920 [Candidatus Promineifilaceae bacterium]